MPRPLAWPLQPHQPPLSKDCTHSPSGKVITTHKNHTQIPFWFQSVSSPLLRSKRKEIILLAEQLVSIAAFSQFIGRAEKVKEEVLSAQKDEKEGGCKQPSWELGRFYAHKEGWMQLTPLSLGLKCVISTFAFCIALFIHHCAYVDNQSYLPPNRDKALKLSERCMPVSI